MDENLVSLIEQLSARIEALEHTVNDTIIGGWKKAEEEYRDNEAYDAFVGKYGTELEPLKPDFALLYGDDFDLPKEMYNQLKSTEGYGADDFDEDGLVRDKILELTEKFGKMKKPAVEENETVVEEHPAEEHPAEEQAIPSVDELKELYRATKL